MRKKYMALLLIAAITVSSLTGCGSKKDSKKVSLDPDNPVSLKVWHYYNGAQQATFDELVEEFNASVGKEEGIYVEEFSYGSVDELEKAVSSSLSGEVGAEELPDMFSSYADTAYAAQKKKKLVDLKTYFTKKELDSYVDAYIEEGDFDQNGKRYLLPVAKSTEVLMVNKTDWEPFAKDTNSSIEELATIEGVTKVAKRYYDWTDAQTPDIPNDGKAFYGRDSMSNYMVIGMRQMGKEVFEAKGGKVKLNLDKKLVRRLWDNYYIPYINGYFAACGKFRSDDVKTGDIIAYTGSTSSACYFPDKVETDEDSYQVECIIADPPIMEGGEPYRVQQGAGMAVTKSDKEHEYASCVFLKWFTQKEQNLRFVSASSYMPVKKDANNMKQLDAVLEKNKIEMNPKTYQCLENVMKNFDASKYYTTKSFKNGYKVRNILGNSIPDQAVKDKEAIDKAIASGTEKKTALKEYISDKHFDEWYQKLSQELDAAILSEDNK